MLLLWCSGSGHHYGHATLESRDIHQTTCTPSWGSERGQMTEQTFLKYDRIFTKEHQSQISHLSVKKKITIHILR